ncbi:MAG: LamG domain-containing protein [Candidatus Limnocylindrales bacterium]
MLETVDLLREARQPRMFVLAVPFQLAAVVALLAVVVAGALVWRLGPSLPGAVATAVPSAASSVCSLESAVSGRWPVFIGRGFAPDTDVVLEIDRADGTHITIEASERAELHTDLEGRFGLTLQPYPSDVGRNSITATAGCSATIESVVTADQVPPACPDAGQAIELPGTHGYRAAVDADAPANWWHLDEVPGDGALDAVGGADGTQVGNVGRLGGTSDALSGAAFFDGESYVELEPVTYADDFTVEAWVYLCDIVDNADAIVGNGEEPPNINFHEEHVRLFTGDDDVVIAATGATLGVWQHWAVTRDEAATRIYLNGVLDANGAAWDGPLTLTMIGHADAGYLRGAIDELAIYDRALGGEELARHFAAR